MEITFSVGDWSRDGHGKNDEICFECSLDRDNLLGAYLEGARILGIKGPAHSPYRLPICTDYGEYTVPVEFVAKLMVAGIDPEICLYYDNSPVPIPSRKKYNSPWSIETNFFPVLWLEIAKLAEPSLTYKQVRKSSIHIGGYGLFS